MGKVERISLLAGDLVEEIRAYSRFQKELWQMVPWLALEADGRTGYLDKYSCAYDSGFWQLDASIHTGHYHTYVDLATGELMDAHSQKKKAADSDILRLAFHLDELDASEIISQLEQQVKKPYPSYYKAHEQDAWRNDLREKLGLEKIFARK